jgi:hypothetical protein
MMHSGAPGKCVVMRDPMHSLLLWFLAMMTQMNQIFFMKSSTYNIMHVKSLYPAHTQRLSFAPGNNLFQYGPVSTFLRMMVVWSSTTKGLELILVQFNKCAT